MCRETGDFACLFVVSWNRVRGQLLTSGVAVGGVVLPVCVNTEQSVQVAVDEPP